VFGQFQLHLTRKLVTLQIVLLRWKEEVAFPNENIRLIFPHGIINAYWALATKTIAGILFLLILREENHEKLFTSSFFSHNARITIWNLAYQHHVTLGILTCLSTQQNANKQINIAALTFLYCSCVLLRLSILPDHHHAALMTSYWTVFSYASRLIKILT
jgi:hypothetical protein